MPKTLKRPCDDELADRQASAHLSAFSGYLPSGLWVQVEIQLYYRTAFSKGATIGFRGVQDIIPTLIDKDGESVPGPLSLEDHAEVRRQMYAAATAYLDLQPNQARIP